MKYKITAAGPGAMTFPERASKPTVSTVFTGPERDVRAQLCAKRDALYRQFQTAGALPTVFISPSPLAASHTQFLSSQFRLKGGPAYAIEVVGPMAHFSGPAVKDAVELLTAPSSVRLLDGNCVVVNAPASTSPNNGAAEESESHVALIVGGSGGLGMATMRQLLQDMRDGKTPNTTVYFTYYSASKEAECDRIGLALSQEFGVAVRAVRLDLGNLASPQSLCHTLENDLPKGAKVNRVILASGVGTSTIYGQDGMTKEADAGAKAARFYQVNAEGPVQLVRALADANFLEENGHGTSVVAIGSVGTSDVVYPFFNPDDGTSKQALELDMLSLAAELGPRHIHIHVQKPGGLTTDMLEQSFLGEYRREHGQAGIQRLVAEGWLTNVEEYAAFLAGMSDPQLGALFAGHSYSTHCGLNSLTIPYSAPLSRGSGAHES